ncbi:MAG: SpoIIE family protein phosphatase [Candidatus Sericytochromatia bacterium]|nr:SpoIIE family protein phosphatase [Candidatus Sericytochromatia bacterium]
MKLFHKTLLAVALTIVVLVVLLSVFWRDTLLGSYSSFERTEMTHHMERVVNTLREDAANPSLRLNDWAAWDSTFRYMADQEPGYIQNNFPVPFTLTDIGVHFAAYVRPDGSVKHSLACSWVGEPRWRPFPASLARCLTRDSVLVNHPHNDSKVGGFLVTPEHILEVGSHPITRGDRQGERRGALVFATVLTDEEIKRLGDIIQVPFAVARLDAGAALSPDLAAAAGRLAGRPPGTVDVLPMDAGRVAGFAVVEDVHGQPALLVSAVMPRAIYAQGLEVASQSLILLAVIGGVFGLLNMLLLRGIVLGRLAALSEQVAAIGSAGGLSARVEASGRDEISTVADKVNGMLSQLEANQAAILELEAWRKGEQRYTELMDASPTIVFIVADGVVVYANPNAGRYFGEASPQALLGRSFVDLLEPGEPREAFVAAVARLAAGTQDLLRMEVKALRRDGERIDLELAANMMQFADCPSVQVLAQDVTETNRAQDRLAQMNKEMEIATRIQTALVPHEMPIDRFDIAMGLVTASEVGGDLIDYIPQADGRFWLAIGDVTGHGLTPGLVMMMAQSMITGYVLDNPHASPAERLVRINEALFHNVRNRMRNDNYMTLQLIHHEGDGRFVAAGMHCDLLIWRAETGLVDRLEVPGFWTGLIPDVAEATTDFRFELAPRDVLLLYSDGLIEASDEVGEQYDMDRLAVALARHAALPVAEIKDRILAEVQAWLTEQLDDISLIVLRRHPDAAPGGGLVEAARV